MRGDDPERELAMAVIQRAVADARDGSVEQKADVWWCMKYGALPFWINVVAETDEGVDAIASEMWRLVGRARNLAS